MKKKEIVIIIYDDILYLENKNYKLENIKNGKVTNYENGKKELEKIIKENKLNKSILNNKINIVVSNNIDDCDVFVYKSIFDSLQFNKIKIFNMKEILTNNLNIENTLLIFFNKENYELNYNYKKYILNNIFDQCIYDYIEKNKIKKIIIFTYLYDVDNIIKNIKSKFNIDVLYNKNIIMQIFLKFA